jgi:hypothetical protein
MILVLIIAIWILVGFFMGIKSLKKYPLQKSWIVCFLFLLAGSIMFPLLSIIFIIQVLHGRNKKIFKPKSLF